MTTFTKPLSLSFLVLALAGCVTFPVEKDLGESTHFVCGDTPLSTLVGEDRAVRINISGNTYPVLQTETIYGMKYESLLSNPSISLLDRGETAVFELDGKAFPACQKINTPGRVELKDYRGIGNDPAWHFVIHNGKMMFNLRYGEKIVTAELPAAHTNGMGQSYMIRTGTQDMRVNVAHKACQDTLTRRYYPDQVSIVFQGKEMKGCGNEVGPADISDDMMKPVPEATTTTAPTQTQAQTQAPAPVAAPTQTVQKSGPTPLSAYTKKTWVVRQLDGKGVLTPSRLTVTFNDEGLYVGQGGCNQFSGAYTINDKVLKIDSNMVQTKRACSPDLDKQEKMFTSILKASTLIDLRGDALIISTPHRKTITFNQASSTDPLVVLP